MVFSTEGFGVVEAIIGQGVSVSTVCRVLRVTDRGYRAWLDRPDDPKNDSPRNGRGDYCQHRLCFPSLLRGSTGPC